jgi:hypothetical protein
MEVLQWQKQKPKQNQKGVVQKQRAAPNVKITQRENQNTAQRTRSAKHINIFTRIIDPQVVP